MRFIKKIALQLIKNKSAFLIFFISALPVLFSWGRLVIGGDIIIPFNSASLEKYLFQWIDVQNGQYFSINYWPYFFLYKIFDFFNLTIYQISAIFLFLLNLIAGFGILKILRLFAKKDGMITLFSITFYLISPALLNSWHYLFIYSFSPLFFYFILKWIKIKRIAWPEIIYLNIIFFFLSVELPNPKYIFHLIIISFFLIIISLLLKIIYPRFIKDNLTKLIVLFLLTAYLFLPQIYFAKNYRADDYGTKTRSEYKDTGKFIDEGSATLDKMFRLHHDGLALNTPEQTSYRNNYLAQAANYIFILIITLLLLRNGRFRDKKNVILFFCLSIIYLFFAAGPNPPFGFIYKFIISNFSLFAFLRTTAGAVFFLSLFYVILLFFFLKNVRKNGKFYFILLLLSLILSSYPLLNGAFYKNVNAINPFTNRDDYGYKIPNGYFEIKECLDKKKIAGKLLFTGSNLSYLSTSWGYFGPMFYNFLYKNNPLYQNGINFYPQFHNVAFILNDNSETNNFKTEEIFGKGNFDNLKKSDFIDLQLLNRSAFLPQFYTPNNSILSKRNADELQRIISDSAWQTRSAVFFEDQDEGKEDILDKFKTLTSPQPSPQAKEGTSLPVLEFKKINPTKYRIRIHGATQEFPLIFSESFHKDWKVYSSKLSSSQVESNLNSYRILNGNEEDQASREELEEYIRKGWVTDLGDEKEKEIKHQKWNKEKQKEELDYTEKYTIDFVSKNFQDTIQNDNLPRGHFWETWFQKPIENNENHLKVNGYANSWIINSEDLCQNNKNCIKNEDGSYDFEVIVEFWPQRIFYLGVGISGSTLLGCLIYLGYDWRKKHVKINSKENEKTN